MVRYIFASHYRMADGLKETVEFLTSVKEICILFQHMLRKTTILKKR